MTVRASYGLALAAAIVVTAGPVRADSADATRGAEILAPFKRNLKEALVNGLAEGPENAIGVCRDQAPSIANALSIDGVRVGRSSHRLRNPSNAAPDWVAGVLDAYLQADSNRAPVVVALDDRRRGYVEPIVMQPLCLTCHGESLSPELAARIEEAYPQDQATGFSVGELRGVFWAEFTAEAPQAR